ncbi:LacI family DNA-binding transcriptional regulator [Demequina sp. SYSU T00039]|uniref:LacI family DNA-binding transcriptional regulator n=1 Tax=Demequina lignilytica TaxID=3051663 RepID=A0AAW7M640_9MICO|nr:MULTISPECIES: LacI family DNA-binding transcriptional regulator [unclassified Demequina]MDN4478685.1 LacI family DNA-binding transcriptional regulator [Demequina sp. SYSU T00039-1]MDN4488663.1 LacI family DNA-binding transcriptional regulator [Demequina sp. SYSU T00039]
MGTRGTGSEATPRSRRGARPSTRASMADVARLAGVSGQTVSRVSNGSLAVREDTRRRVLDAMETLGYSPNTAARALRSGSFETIGVIAHRLARTGESRTVEGVVRAAHERGHTVTLLDLESTAHEDVSAAAMRLSHQAIDGLIIIRAETADASQVALPSTLPVVVADAGFGGDLPMVGGDHATGARAAVEHLLALGHRTVHHVAGPVGSIPAQARLEAWRAVLGEHGIVPPEPVRGDWTSASGEAVGAALAARSEATAVFCANDEMAAGLMLALTRAGRRVPEDVSVVGFDDIPLAGYLTTPLTTVRQPFAEIGALLVDRLMARIEDPAAAPGGAVLVPCELVVRESTAPPR